MKALLLTGTVVAVAVLVLPGSGFARTEYANATTARITTVRVTAKDFAFVLSRKTVPHGRVRFVIRNVSASPHNFAIAGHVSKTIGRGKSTTLTVMLKRGRYPYKCKVDSHAKLGMKGMLRAK
jgi:plastocyanin